MSYVDTTSQGGAGIVAEEERNQLEEKRLTKAMFVDPAKQEEIERKLREKEEEKRRAEDAKLKLDDRLRAWEEQKARDSVFKEAEEEEKKKQAAAALLNKFKF
eukprot:TRINITY_DN4748_c0_g1_i2.p1 TRINITY_DN4748_c0_g1~~TRINITY_DN4748_c0_g1_i2.p1  ORF type:complete len:103 (+),score=42.34 TRINITY_DN4748_c0_g1_i2:24-332(+)